MALTFADLDAKLPRSNTVTSNQRYILNLLDNRRTSQKDRTTAIAYVFANRKKFEPVNIGTVPYPLSEELDLKVNGKYDDLVVLYVEGTYAMNEDQTVITLTPDSESDPGATVTKNEDGTYTYVSTDGDEVTLAEVKPVEVAYALKGQIPVPGMDGVNADFVCNLYDDSTVRLYADFMGNQMDVDQGTYEIDMTTYSFIIHFENAGDLTTEGYAADMVLNYKIAEVAPFGAIEQTLKFVTE